MINKPFSESCEQNKNHILDILRVEFHTSQHVLEIGSGTGQHAVFFSKHLPHLTWQCSDRTENLPGITSWLDDAALNNTPPTIELDVSNNNWPNFKVDAIFSANAVHIMSWSDVKAMFRGVNNILKEGGRLCLYGPFNYQGAYSSESNANFDHWLKTRNPKSGIRDFEAIDKMAIEMGLCLINDYEMPANNRILVWQRKSV